MRIAMISEHASPLATIAGVDAGGQNQHVAELAAALANQGHQVTVYTRCDHPGLPERVTVDRGFDVVHVPAGPPTSIPKDDLLPFMPPFGRWLSRHWQRTGRPDVVHAHFWMSGVAALVATASTGVPVVLTYHALGIVKRRHQQAADSSPAVRIELETKLGHSVDRVIAQCPDEVAELTAMGVPATKLVVSPSGVDSRRFTPDGPAAPRRRGHQRIFAAGRMVERKGFEDLLFAIRQLPRAELVIAGGPPPAPGAAGDLADDPEAGRLLELARTLGVSGRVRLLGAVPAREMPSWYRSADLVACVPWYEPFGLTPLEAMACGVPVVAYAVGGLRTTIVDGVTGTLVPPGDGPALVTALAELLDDDDRRGRMAVAARLRAVHDYDWDSRASAVGQIYAGLVARPGVLAAVTA